MGFDKCVKSCIHHVQSNFTALKILCLTYSCLCTFSRNLNNRWPFVISIAFVSPEYHLVGTVKLVAFPDWLISLLSIQFTFVDVFLWLDSSIIFFNLLFIIVWEREWKCVGRGRGRGRENLQQPPRSAGNPSDVGLDIVPLRSWPEPKSRVGCLTEWASYVLR